MASQPTILGPQDPEEEARRKQASPTLSGAPGLAEAGPPPATGDAGVLQSSGLKKLDELKSPLLAKEETKESLDEGAVREEVPEEAPKKEEDKLTVGDVAGDLAMMLPRGMEGFAESVGGLFGSKWDRKDWSIFGTSKTMVGVFGENIVQFGIGMIPGLMSAGLIGKAAKLAKIAKVAKARKAGKMSSLARGNRSFDIKTLRRIAKAKKATRRAIVFGYAGAVADIVSFKGQEERLSNLLQSAGVDNAFVDYLAYNPEQNPTEMEGRLKNAIEGLFVGGAVGGAIGGVRYLSSIFRKFRKKNELVAKGMDEDDAIDIAQGEADAAHAANPGDAQGLLGTNESIIHQEAVREHGAWPRPIRAGGAPRHTFGERGAVDELPFGDGGGITGAPHAQVEAFALSVAGRMQKGGQLGVCAFCVAEVAKKFPDWKVVKGHHDRASMVHHAWLVGPRGQILDPTANQFGTGPLKADMPGNLPAGLITDPALIKEYKPFTPEELVAMQRFSDGGMAMDVFDLANETSFVRGTSDFSPVLDNLEQYRGEEGMWEDMAVPAIAHLKESLAKFKASQKKAADELPFDKGKPKATDGTREETVEVLDAAGNVIETKTKTIPLPKIGGKDARKVDISKANERELDEFLGEFDLDIPDMVGNLESKRTMAREIIENIEGADKTLKDIRKAIDTVMEKDVDAFLGTGELAVAAGRKLLAGIKNNEGLVSLARYMAKRAVIMGRASREAAGAKGNADVLYDKIRKNIDDVDGWGMDRQQAQGKLMQARSNLEALETIHDEQESIRKLYSFFAEDVQRAAGVADEARIGAKRGHSGTKDSYEKAMTDVHSALDKFNAVQELWADYGTTLSMGMLQRKFIYRGMGSGGMKHNTRNLGFDLTATGKTGMDEMLFQRKVRGGRSKKAFLKELRAATSGNDMELRLAKIAKSSQNGSSRTLTWYLNALLGSPMTMSVNLVGNGIMKAFRDFEVMAGAMAQFGVTGNSALLKANLKAVFDFESFYEALKFAKITMKTMEPRSIAGYTAYSDNRFEDLKGGWHFGDSKDPLTIAGNWFGNTVTFPSRILMAGDELFKQWNYRSYIKTDLAMEATRKGIKDPKEVAAYIHHNFENFVTKEGRFRNEANVYKEASNRADDEGLKFAERGESIDNYMEENFYSNNMRLADGTIYKTTRDRDNLVERATDWSLINTFTNPVENEGAKILQQFAMGNRWFALVVPFVRTPTNILTFALSRTIPGLGGLHKVGEMGTGLKYPWQAGKRSYELTKRYDDVTKGKDPGFEAVGAEKAYVKSGFNEPEVIYTELKGAPAHYLKPGTKYAKKELLPGARGTDRPTKTSPAKAPAEGVIEIDRARLKEMYEAKLYAHPTRKFKGHKVDALPEDQFKTFEDFEDFTIQHEKAHQHIKKRKGEATHIYENRINQAALKAQAFNNESGTGWKKTIQKLYADMPRAEAMAKEYAAIVMQGESRQAAEYIGRITTSTMLAATVYFNLDKIRDRITGKAPKRESERAAWLADGKQEYSFHYKGKWVSYQRLDPFATIVGIYADLMHYGESAVDNQEGIFTDEDEKVIGMHTVQKIMAVISMSFSNNITNKSYLQGISDMLDFIREPAEGIQLPRNVIGGFVPNYLNWSQNLGTDEPEILEARKLLDGFLKRLPEFMRPELPETMVSSSSLMPRRNFLGEKMTKQNKGPIGGWFPGILGMDARTDISNDIVDLEFSSLGTAFKTKQSTWSGELQTTGYRNRNGGQTAYDRHQELMSETKISGKTLRQALRFIIGTDEYQSLMPATDRAIGEAHPRTKALSKIVSFYSQNAKNQVIQEYPELKADYYELMRRKEEQRKPR